MAIKILKLCVLSQEHRANHLWIPETSEFNVNQVKSEDFVYIDRQSFIIPFRNGLMIIFVKMRGPTLFSSSQKMF